MKLKMLDERQAQQVIKGALREYIARHGHAPVTSQSAGGATSEVFRRIEGTMRQMAQEDLNADGFVTRELKELRKKWNNNKDTSDYWMQRAHNAEAELAKNGLPVPDPPKIEPRKEAADPKALDTLRVEAEKALHDHREGSPKRRAFMAAIAESHRIIGLPTDPEAELGADCPVTETAWRSATECLTGLFNYFQETFGVELDVPDISPGPAGSVDVHWNRPQYEFLLNVPADGLTPAFYGDNKGCVGVEGTLLRRENR